MSPKEYSCWEKVKLFFFGLAGIPANLFPPVDPDPVVRVSSEQAEEALDQLAKRFGEKDWLVYLAAEVDEEYGWRVEIGVLPSAYADVLVRDAKWLPPFINGVPLRVESCERGKSIGKKP